MTAPILRPGDKIHLAVPCSTRDNEADIVKLVALLRPDYDAMGVAIHCVSATSILDAPRVVAVFRNEITDAEKMAIDIARKTLELVDERP